MNLTIDRDELASALAAACAVVPTKTTRPILEYALIVAESGKAELFATDLDVSIRLRLGLCDVGAAGRACFPAKKALAIVKSLDGAKVTLATSGEKGIDTAISDGASKFTLRGEDAASFPDLSDLGHREPELWLPTSVLAGGIARVAFAAAEEGGEHRQFAMNGVNVGRREARLRLAATDGVAFAHFDQKTEAGRDIAHTLTLKACRVMESVAAGAERLGLAFGEHATTITAGERTTLRAPAVNAPFPDLDKLGLDFSDHKSFEIDRAKFLAALRRVGLVIEGKKTFAVLLSLRNGGVSVSALDSSADGRSDVPAAYSGDPVEVALNVRMLSAALDAVNAEKVTVRVSDAGKPVTVEDGAGWAYMLMPIDHVGYAEIKAADEKKAGAKKEKANAAAT